MAQRRMFSKSITNSSQFLMMPHSSQGLYFHLGMNADDDGFCEHFSIMRMTDSKPDDLKILQAKGFVNVFDDKVLVIIDWKENNYLRADRYTPSKYLEVYKDEIHRLSSGIPSVNQRLPQDRIGEVRLGKDSKGKNTTSEETSQVNFFIDLFKVINPSYKKFFGNKSQRAAAKRLLDTHGLNKLEKILIALPQSNQTDFMPVITTPCQLEDKFAQLATAWQKLKNKQPIIL